MIKRMWNFVEWLDISQDQYRFEFLQTAPLKIITESRGKNCNFLFIQFSKYF